MATNAIKNAILFIITCFPRLIHVYANDMSAKRKSLFLTLLTSCTLIADCASAHASEQGLVLLLPTDVYAAAGTLTVIVSIVFVTCMPREFLMMSFRGADLGLRRGSKREAVFLASSLVASAVFLFLIFIGFTGPTDPQNNLLPLTIWTVWWVGVFVVQGTVFDVWRWVNPWTGLVRFLDLGRKPIITIPEKVGAWPAVAVLICFQLFLLADIAPSDPQRLASIVLGYWIFTLIGIELCGQDAWLRRVECFTVMFRLIGSLRPIQGGENPRFGLPGWVGLSIAPLGFSYAVFCLVVLAGGSFDGVNETFWWLAQIGINPLAFPGRSAVMWSSALGLIGAIILLCTVFGFAIWIGLKAVQLLGSAQRLSFIHTFTMFAVTLLPIALGYHFAHYLVTFMVQIKVALSTASDPFALGWNLAGLGAVKATVGFLSVPQTVKTIWIVQAGVVVVSHIISVLMSHHVACKLCGNNKDVVLIQIGLTALMIAYTVFGLWLLASPRGA
jgi:hypothetical protein